MSACLFCFAEMHNSFFNNMGGKNFKLESSIIYWPLLYLKHWVNFFEKFGEVFKKVYNNSFPKQLNCYANYFVHQDQIFFKGKSNFEFKIACQEKNIQDRWHQWSTQPDLHCFRLKFVFFCQKSGDGCADVRKQLSLPAVTVGSAEWIIRHCFCGQKMSPNENSKHTTRHYHLWDQNSGF